MLKRFFKFTLCIIIMLFGCIILAYYTTPWRQWTAVFVTKKLKEQNIPIKSFAIGDITTKGLQITDIHLTTQPETIIPMVRVKYDINTKKITNIEIDKFTYKVNSNKKPSQSEDNNKFILESFPSPTSLKSLPFEYLKAQNIEIVYKDSKNKVTANINLDIEVNTKLSSIKMNAKNSNVTAKDKTYIIEDTHLSLLPSNTDDSKIYSITGKLGKIRGDENNALAWLPLTVEIKGTLSPEELRFKINAKHKKFNITSYYTNTNLKSELSNIKINIAGGVITADKIPLNKASFVTKLNIDSVSLEKVLKFALTDDESIKATGNISGTIPLKKTPKGFNFEGANMYNLTNGTLSLSEKHLSALPQNIEQIKNTSDLLKNFMYDDLKLLTQSYNDKLEISAKLQGNNPEVYNGARVNLNINFRGDIMETISSMLGLEDISKYKGTGK